MWDNLSHWMCMHPSDMLYMPIGQSTFFAWYV